MNECGDGTNKQCLVEAECEGVALLDDAGVVFGLGLLERFELAGAREADGDGGGGDVEEGLDGGLNEAFFDLLCWGDGGERGGR